LTDPNPLGLKGTKTSGIQKLSRPGLILTKFFLPKDDQNTFRDEIRSPNPVTKFPYWVSPGTWSDAVKFLSFPSSCLPDEESKISRSKLLSRIVALLPKHFHVASSRPRPSPSSRPTGTPRAFGAPERVLYQVGHLMRPFTSVFHHALGKAARTGLLET
jgi:hypothetical protein